MRWIRDWARASNERAIDNARSATVECSRRGVERREVDLYLRSRAARRAAVAADVASVTRSPA